MADSPNFGFRNPFEAASRVADKWSAILSRTDNGEQPVIFDTAICDSDVEDASSSWITEDSSNAIKSDRSTSVERRGSSDDHQDRTLRTGVATDDAEPGTSREPEGHECRIFSDSDSDDSVASVWEGLTPESVPECPLGLLRTPLLRPDDILRRMMGEERFQLWNSFYQKGPPKDK